MNAKNLGIITAILFVVGALMAIGLFAPFHPAGCTSGNFAQCLSSNVIFSGNQNITVGYALMVIAILLNLVPKKMIG